VEESKDSLVIDEDGQHPFLTHSMAYDDGDEALVIELKKVMVASNHNKKS